MSLDLFLKIILIIGVLFIIYALFFRPRILTWGTSKGEVAMPLIGDDLAHGISATRAISIDAPIAEVWKWVIQLGADRGGFFSYSFLERALGYKMREAEAVPEFLDMEVGRVVPGSIDETKSLIRFNFPVVAVEAGKSFVLEGWGAFVLEEISPTQTRLIVRTHGQDTRTLLRKIDDFFGVALHYIMERRMLLGFKVQAEAGPGVRLSATPDYLWILGIFLSALGTALMVLLAGSALQIILSIIFGILWLYAFLIVNPRSMFSTFLFLLIAAAINWLY